jgi:3'-phosphoadenosine 5'-phosphosulfate sulfotransferase (PAPS reductase)/FAD synthetase
MKRLINIEATKERIGSASVICSISGGKDSAAMALALLEADIPFRAVFMDTGWEHDETYSYLETLETRIGRIERLEADIPIKDDMRPYVEELEAMLGRRSAMIRLIFKKKMTPQRQARYCTGALKLAPIVGFLTGLEDEAINAVGIRRDESATRREMEAWEWFEKGDCYTWRPIIDWSYDDVIEIHRRHNLEPNPLYLRGPGVNRVGCWPCIYARKAEIRNIADNDPDRIRVLERLEAILTEITGSPRAWFTPRGPNSLPFGIEKVVQWSRTSRGGRQFELFDASERERGCLRWGMCDTGGAKQ